MKYSRSIKLISSTILTVCLLCNSVFCFAANDQSQISNKEHIKLQALIEKYGLVVDDNASVTDSTPVFTSVDDYEAALLKVIAMAKNTDEKSSVPIPLTATDSMMASSTAAATTATTYSGYKTMTMTNVGVACNVLVTVSYHHNSSGYYTSVDNVNVVGSGLQSGTEYIKTAWLGTPISAWVYNNGHWYYTPSVPGTGFYSQWTGYIKYTVVVSGVTITYNSGESWGYWAHMGQ